MTTLPSLTRPARNPIAASVVAGLLALGGSEPAAAQTAAWPTKPVRLVVPYTPGNITDIAARVISQKLSEASGQPVVVENKPGAGTQIGTAEVARAAPDGSTLLLTGAGFATNPALFPRLPYDSAKDFEPVTLVVSNPLVLVVNPSRPATSIQALIAAASAGARPVTLGSGGNGTLSHMAAELLAASSPGAKWLHVPYRGGSAAVTDVLGGQIDGMFDNPSSAVPHIQAGKTRALGVSGSARIPALPEVPTVAEAGVAGFEVVNWFGLFAPARTPPEVLERINAEIAQILKSPDVVARFAKDGVTAGGNGRAEFAAFVREETEKWGRIIRDRGIKAD